MRSHRAVAALLVTLTASLAIAQDAPAPARKGDPYTLPTCPISNMQLGPDAVVFVLTGAEEPRNEGREIRFCCPKCIDTFKADTKKYLAEIDAKMVVEQLKVYPAGNCAVMPDDELADPRGPEAMDDKNIIIGNRLVRFCCGKCIKKFVANPEKYQPTIDAAIIAMQKPTYPLTTCPISGKPLGETAQDIIVANRLVRICCPGCAEAVRKDPLAAFAKIDAAAKAKP